LFNKSLLKVKEELKLDNFPFKILYVDLTKENTWVGEICKENIEKYLGSRGINAKLLWEEKSIDHDPLDPKNVLIFSPGLLTGTSAPSSGRTTVTFKSPLTGIYLKSSVGGHWGTALKFAGYSTLVVKGKAQNPVYIFINNGQIQIRDASHLWRLDTRKTTQAIKEELNDKEVEVACIGPAGENKVRFASIMFNIYNAAARGGGGALMGSKLLKAIAIKGEKPLFVYDEKNFHELVTNLRKKLSQDSGAKSLSKYGTAGVIDMVNPIYALPSYNFKENHIDNGHLLGGQHLRDAKYLKRRFACNACGIGCHRYTEVDQGIHRGSFSGGPEFETLASLGAGCGITDTKAVLRANELCNIYGLDTISAGSVIQWAMECREKGVISREETDGIDLIWGNSEAMLKMLEKITFREGFGDILADGVKKASETIKNDSWKWAIQAKGLEQSRVEIRLRKGYSLAFAVNPRGPDHLFTECVAESGRTEEAKLLIKKICGDEKYANPYTLNKRAEIVRWHEDCYAVSDALGICAFTTTLAYAITPKAMAELFTAATGIEMTEDKIMVAGRRITTLEKCYNLRLGLDRSADTLPWRIMNEPIKSGPQKGMLCSKEDLDKMLDEYYTLHGWDKKTSWPKMQTLIKLGLENVGKELEQIINLKKRR